MKKRAHRVEVIQSRPSGAAWRKIKGFLGKETRASIVFDGHGPGVRRAIKAAAKNLKPIVEAHGDAVKLTAERLPKHKDHESGVVYVDVITGHPMRKTEADELYREVLRIVVPSVVNLGQIRVRWDETDKIAPSVALELLHVAGSVQ